MGLGVFRGRPVLRRTGTAATGTDRQGSARLDAQDLFHPQVKVPAGGDVLVVSESFRGPQAKIAQPNHPRVSVDAGTTDVADAVVATLDDELVAGAYPSSRRRSATPRADRRSLFRLDQQPAARSADGHRAPPPAVGTRSGRGAGCIVSGIRPILPLRTDGPPGSAPPTVCTALPQFYSVSGSPMSTGPEPRRAEIRPRPALAPAAASPSTQTTSPTPKPSPQSPASPAETFRLSERLFIQIDRGHEDPTT